MPLIGGDEIWTRRAVGPKNQRVNWTNPDCVPLLTVSHVTHVDLALEIVRQGEISTQLIYDESGLNIERITGIALT